LDRRKAHSEAITVIFEAEYSRAETIMLHSDGVRGAPLLDFEAWRALLRSNCGGEVEVTAPDVFAGWMRPLNACGLTAAAVKIQCEAAAGDLGCYTHRLERTYRDVRLDGSDHYLIVSQVAGQSAMTQTRAGRLLFDLIRDVDTEAAFSSADSYMQLAAHDVQSPAS
jgi:hypothetical protein